MSRYSIVMAALFVGVAACAPMSPSGSAPVVAPAGGGRNFISEEEIRTAAAANALDLVRGLRPMWLNKRGPQSLHYEGEIVVYLGTARLGGIQSLGELAVGTLTSLQFLDAAAANYRFGPGHPYGVILVSTALPASR